MQFVYGPQFGVVVLILYMIKYSQLLKLLLKYDQFFLQNLRQPTCSLATFPSIASENWRVNGMIMV